ncbi:hypothetical protein IAT38_006431 [Cryptococcus sp. DSM 104549]
MSSTAWPPSLKAWVADCLSQGTTTSKKDAINAELKQILFQAHADGTIYTTDWSTVKLEVLKPPSAPPISIALPGPSAPGPAPPPRVFSSPAYGSALTPPAVYPRPVSPAPAPALKQKKKKKNDGASTTSKFPSPYHFTSTEEEAAKARRAARFQAPADTTPSTQGGGLNAWFDTTGNGGVGGVGSMVPGQVGKRKMKSGLGYEGDQTEEDPNVIDWDKYTIRGTCTKLEKRYLRLTSEPSPADIRPLHVLQQTLELLKSKWKQDHNYTYALDQFKSMRQDLTVQRIKNNFTVSVYEIHARIALEAKDLGEYNQCQTMLRHLYELGLEGHPLEFLSYRIMYLFYSRNRSDMAALLAQLTDAEKNDEGVKHALDVHASLATSNYARFFTLFTNAPNMSGYIMDHFVERERMSALAIMSRAYLTLPLHYITSVLALGSNDEADQFLEDHKAAIYVTRPDQKGPVPLSERTWDCKKAHYFCQMGIEKYRVVDLKGQVD